MAVVFSSRWTAPEKTQNPSQKQNGGAMSSVLPTLCSNGLSNPFLCRHMRPMGRRCPLMAPAAALAAAAGAAGCTVPAAGAFTRFPIADHAADQQRDDQHQGRKQRDIDKIGRHPIQHTITSFLGGAARQKRREPALAAPPSWDGEVIVRSVSGLPYRA